MEKKFRKHYIFGKALTTLYLSQGLKNALTQRKLIYLRLYCVVSINFMQYYYNIPLQFQNVCRTTMKKLRKINCTGIEII